MARKPHVGDIVYVPCQKVQGLAERSSSLYRTTVVEVNDRSVKLNLPGQNISDWIGSALIHHTVGIYIFSIGDFETEETLINPLTKSILQFCRLIHEDDTNSVVRTIRSLFELKKFWQADLRAFKYVILIGHGSPEGLKFGDDWHGANDIVGVLEGQTTSEKTIISLCCQTGYKSFSQPLSELPFCTSVIAPFHSVHGAVASQFCQTFLVNHLLAGNTGKSAFNRARENIAGSASFRLWQKGKLTEGPAK